MSGFDVQCSRCLMFKYDATTGDASDWMTKHQDAHDVIDAQKKNEPPLPKVMAPRFARSRKKEKV